MGRISWRWRLGLWAGLALLIYFPALRAGFIWDDDVYVTGNALLKSLDGLWNIWFHPVRLPQYYPLTFSSFWIEYHLWGLHAAGYHAVNILLHTLNSLLVGRLLERLKIPGAWFAALLFLVHPVHVESVAWITERKNVLSGFFYLSAFLSYFKFRDREPEFRFWYFTSFFLFLAALLSKTISGTFPAAVILISWWKDGKFPKKDLLGLIPFFFAAAILSFITIHFENWHIAGMPEEWRFSLEERLLIAGRAFWFYLGKLVWPHPLIFIYPRWILDASSFGQWLFPLAFILLTLILWKFRPKSGRGTWFAFLIFTLTLFPALGFKTYFPMLFSFVADHFQYLASIAFFALFAALFQTLSVKTPRLQRTLAGVLLIMLSILTWNQCHIYKDPETLWRDTLKKNPAAWMAHNNLGSVLMDKGLYQEASLHVEESIRLNSHNADAYNNLGNLAAKRNDLQQSIEYFSRALEILPEDSDAHNNLGVSLFDSGRVEEAVEHFLKAIADFPDFTFPRCNLGNIAMARGDIPTAVRWYREALALDPDYADAHVNLGVALFQSDQIDQAMEHYLKALKLKPDLGIAHLYLAEALTSKNLNGQAEEHFQEAIRSTPGNIQCRFSYAAFLENLGRTGEAIQQYREILRLAPENQDAQKNLQRLTPRDIQR